MNSTLAWALEWARRGFRVFPIVENGKQPLWAGWTELASMDPAQIRAWWHTNSPGGLIEQNYNIAILTTGWLVIDIDIKGGKQGLGNFFMMGGDFDTLTIRTPTGGYHLYYKPPYEVANSQGDQGGIEPGIDGRAYHGFVLAGGSVIDGVPYRIELDMPVAEAPEFFYSRCKRPSEYLGRDRVRTPLVDLDTPLAHKLAIEYLREHAKTGVTGQGHNQTLFHTACEVRDRGVSETVAVDLMMDHWNMRCTPPLGREELARVVSNAYSYAQNAEGAKHPGAGFAHIEIEPPVWVQSPDGSVIEILGASNPVPIMSTTEVPDPEAVAWGNAIPFENLKPRPWLVKPMLLRGEVTGLIAPGGVGKSQVILTIAVYLALGLDVFDKFKNVHRGTPKRSIIYNAEDSRAEMTMRLYATCADMGVDPKLVVPYIMLLSGKEEAARTRLVKVDKGQPIINGDAISGFINLAKHPDCVLVSFDPLLKIHEVRESDNRDMAYVMETLEMIATRADVAVLIAAHTAKPGFAASTGSYIGSADAARGAKSIADSARAAYTLAAPTDEDATLFGLSKQERNRLLRLDDAKFNRSLLGDDTLWLEKRTIILFTGEEVGAFRPAVVSDRTEIIRRNIGLILATEMTAKSTASIAVQEALAALRKHDPIFGQIKQRDARQRFEQNLVRPIELEDGRTVQIEVKGGTKLVTLR